LIDDEKSEVTIFRDRRKRQNVPVGFQREHNPCRTREMLTRRICPTFKPAYPYCGIS
jgi:hypothetical protein